MTENMHYRTQLMRQNDFTCNVMPYCAEHISLKHFSACKNVCLGGTSASPDIIVPPDIILSLPLFHFISTMAGQEYGTVVWKHSETAVCLQFSVSLFWVFGGVQQAFHAKVWLKYGSEFSRLAQKIEL